MRKLIIQFNKWNYSMNLNEFNEFNQIYNLKSIHLYKQYSHFTAFWILSETFSPNWKEFNCFINSSKNRRHSRVMTDSISLSCRFTSFLSPCLLSCVPWQNCCESPPCCIPCGQSGLHQPQRRCLFPVWLLAVFRLQGPVELSQTAHSDSPVIQSQSVLPLVPLTGLSTKTTTKDNYARRV